MKGRRPQPTALHLLKGNPSHRRGGTKVDPAPPPLVDLTPPATLSAAAAAVWDLEAPGLARLGVLTETDRAILAVYCETRVTWALATALARAEGLTVDTEKGPQVHPAVKVAAQAATHLRNLSVELGLTPAARARVRVTAPEAKPLSKWGGLL